MVVDRPRTIRKMYYLLYLGDFKPDNVSTEVTKTLYPVFLGVGGILLIVVVVPQKNPKPLEELYWVKPVD